MEWTGIHQPAVYERLAAGFGQATAFAEAQARPTVGQLQRELNRPDALRDNHRWYLDTAQVVDGDDFVGTEWVAVVSP